MLRSCVACLNNVGICCIRVSLCAMVYRVQGEGTSAVLPMSHREHGIASSISSSSAYKTSYINTYPLKEYTLV